VEEECQAGEGKVIGFCPDSFPSDSEDEGVVPGVSLYLKNKCEIEDSDRSFSDQNEDSIE